MTRPTQGILRPFRLGANGNPVTGDGEELRMSRIGQVLGTRRRNQRGSGGELLWFQNFGSRFEQIRQTNFSPIRQPLAHIFAAEALALAMPDEVVVSTVAEQEEQDLNVTIYTQRRQELSRDIRPTKTVVTLRK